MNNLLKILNKHLTEYLSDYPEIMVPKMEFSYNIKGELSFNSYPLCNCDDLILEKAEILLDQISFHFNYDRFIKIDLLWTEDSPPIISAVTFGYSLNCEKKDENKSLGFI